MPDIAACEALIESWSQQIAAAEPGRAFMIQGGGTKPAMLSWSPQDSSDLSSESRRPLADSQIQAELLSTTELRGIIDYRPDEFTVTAYAGTPIHELAEVLAQSQQYLPFEPPFQVPTGPAGTGAPLREQMAARSTLGGTICAGINGPGRWRYGGLRDFVLEVRYIDGMGQIRRGGRRVVKNAAGFDIPKLLVGSCGRLGVLVDVTLKVFPKPQDYLTLHVLSENIDSTTEILAILVSQPWDIDAIETTIDGSILVRLAGREAGLVKHGQRIQSRLSKHYSSFLREDQQHRAWSGLADWLWGRQDQCLIKVPVSLRGLYDLDEAMEEMEIQRSIGAGGNLAWLQWNAVLENHPARLKRLNKALAQQKLCGQVVQGPSPQSLWGASPLSEFYRRLKTVFDPQGRLGSF